MRNAKGHRQFGVATVRNKAGDFFFFWTKMAIEMFCGSWFVFWCAGY